jgi:CHAD domain-containing protein
LIRSNAFIKDFKGRTKSLSKRLKLFVKNPNEENAHDVRTAVRRVEVGISVLPSSSRTRRRTKKFRRVFRKLLKQSAKVRDLDIIYSRLSKYPTAPGRDKLMQDLKKRRKEVVQRTKDFTTIATKISPPNLKPKMISDTKLGRRFNRVVGKLAAKINKRLPLVLADETKIDDLHKVRIDSKRLRYVLELAPGDKQSEKLLSVLRDWQDALGSVRDIDVTLDFLRGLPKSPETDEILTKETNNRKQGYEKFVQLCKERPGAKIPS